MSYPPLILASASPRRRELMEKIGLPFSVTVSDCDETLPEDTPADRAAELLAVRKAEAVAAAHPEALVIGADTTVIHGDTVLGKPADREDCIRMLRLLSGDTHRVQTGCALICGDRRRSFTAETLVTFYPLTDAEITAYADSDEPYDKAGAYGIQGIGGLLIEGIRGDYYNVVGLPVARLARELRKFRLP
ncbi:MAG: septum formation protein Maf [Oscillospiraceae bacterium]|nr:septum formation protein Maf [Oscillospiraceae bacterium]